MARYAVTGDVLCATSDTGEPTGTQNGYPVYQWTNENGNWTLLVITVISQSIQIHLVTGDPVVGGAVGWSRATNTFLGNYAPVNGATGTATVAEYVAPTPDEYITVRWRASGEVTVLKMR